MNDRELFELCRDVYARTGWKPRLPQRFFYKVDGVEMELDTLRVTDNPRRDVEPIAPLYTSDYLLEKLPKTVKDDELTYWLDLYADNDGWATGYEAADTSRFDVFEPTPLKALLKLTIALHEAGELS